jgi:hypothetical protein
MFVVLINKLLILLGSSLAYPEGHPLNIASEDGKLSPSTSFRACAYGKEKKLS